LARNKKTPASTESSVLAAGVVAQILAGAAARRSIDILPLFGAEVNIFGAE
jgi:hypothetical protein